MHKHLPIDENNASSMRRKAKTTGSLSFSLCLSTCRCLD
jgi:hypothetical protein